MYKTKSGFTIVELLIVIVVIAILAAISTIAFTGVQARARESAAASSLQQANRAMALWRTDNSDTTPENLDAIGVVDSGKIKYQYSRTNSNANYCITVSIDNVVSYYINDLGQKTPTKGACDGHVDAGATPGAPDTSIAFTSTSTWTMTTGAGASKTEGDEVWPSYIVGSGPLTGANLYLTTARPLSQLHNLDISWQVSTYATNAGSQYNDIAVVKGDVALPANYGSWNTNSVRASIGLTGQGVWKTVRWQSTVSGTTLTWSATLDGVSIGSGTKNISTWPNWRLVPINSYGNRNNAQAGVKGTITLP